MALPHLNSRLSPPPGVSVPDLLQVAGAISDPSRTLSRSAGLDDTPPRDTGATSGSGRRRDDAPKRGYRACVHCRLRKAKCDLGDVNSPAEPPCTRCRREQRQCVFLPSKRRKKRGTDEDDGNAADISMQTPVKHEWTLPIQSDGRYGGWPESLPPSAFQDGQSSTSIFAYPDLPQRPRDRPSQTEFARPTSFNASYAQQHAHGPVDPPSLSDTTPDSNASALSPNQTNARHKKHKGPDATRRIVVANFSNETDALEILANAATDEDKGQGGDAKSGKRVLWKDEQAHGDYLLVRKGVLGEGTVWELVQVYFRHYHPFLPIFQTNRIPRNIDALRTLMAEEPFIVSCLIIVASRHHSDPRMKLIHEQSWSLVRDAIGDYCFGGVETSVGFVEGLLILAEYLPREKIKGGGNKDSIELLAGKGEGGLHGIENRRGWNLTGLAIRAAYGLGLDQLAMDLNHERTPDFERARLAFTWCYLYDRTIDKSPRDIADPRLRTGLAFWSRGPAICFTGYSHLSQTGEAAAKENFPSMISPADSSDEPRGGSGDSASFIQALMELTQIMTNAHDTLYPNRDRTNDLVRMGAYFRFLDSFRRALESFRLVWDPKEWRDSNLKELTWCTFEMVRLYVSSFAFQAHVQRAWLRAEEEGAAGAAAMASASTGANAPLMSMAGMAGGVQLFPRGSATSPDALYIYQSIDAAVEILSICLSLSQKGVLRYLPSRYLINFVFGGVFALKAAYSGAQGRADLARTRELVDRVCAALVLASPDRDHPASRYGQMLRLLTKKLEELSEQSAVPSRFQSPEADPAPEASGQPAWDQLILPELPSLDPTQAFGVDLAQGSTGLEGLFDMDVDVNFNMEGFWDDFTLAEGTGFPFR